MPGQSIAQARLALSGALTVRIVEHPQSAEDIDEYNTTVTVLGGERAKTYEVKELIKYGEPLRLVETATVCESPDRGSLILAFEAGSTAEMEGFMIIRYSARGVDVQALPSAIQGGIAVQGDKITLWSAVGSIGIDCGACDKLYSVQVCQMGRQQLACSKQQGTVGPISPAKFRRSRIVLR